MLKKISGNLQISPKIIDENTMITVCLVTNELYPITHGGCGTLIYNSVYSLLESGFRVIILADISPNILVDFASRHLSHFPNLKNLKIFCLSDLISQEVNRSNITHEGLRQSWRFYQGLKRLINSISTPIDIIEIPDYLGYGYYTLLMKSEEVFNNVRIYIRFHGTMECIDQAMPYMMPVGENRILAYGLERWCLNQADCVLVPSTIIEDKVKKIYHPDRIIISTPSFSGLNIVPRCSGLRKFRILFYARLAPAKGAELFIRAALEWIKSDGELDKTIRFTIAGPDMRGGPGNISMMAYLKSIIPNKYRKYFDFLGNLDRSMLDRLLPSVLFAVFPSSSESYCYAARELAIAGVPLICSDIPELQDLISDGVAVSAPLNVSAWAQKMREYYIKYSTGTYEDRYWEPSNSLADSYRLDILIKNNKSKVSVNDEMYVLFFVFASQYKDEIDFPLYHVLSDVSFRYKLIFAYEDERGTLVLRGKRRRLSAEVPEKFTILCFLDEHDIVSSEYLDWAINKFENDARISIITCPCISNYDYQDVLPFHVAPSLLPFKEPSSLKRALLRVNTDIKELCFDPFFLELNETAAIWEILQDPEAQWEHTQRWVINITCNCQDYKSPGINRAITNLLYRYADKTCIPLMQKTLVHLAVHSLDMYQVSSVLKQGGTPEIGDVRCNVSGILKLLVLRLIGIKKFYCDRFFSMLSRP